jgi:NAD(P)H-hydrate epimerase
MPTLTREQIRSLDRIAVTRFGIPGIVLMENAGRGATEVLLRRLAPAPDTSILVVAGPGNNGGDGFVIARHLANRGHRVSVALLGELDRFRGAGEAGTNFDIIEKMRLPLFEEADHSTLQDSLTAAGLVVDAVLGTGLAGDVRGPAARAIEAMNSCGRPVFAVDIPSGLDCDTGHPLGTAVRACATATFAAMKKGLAERHAEVYTGPVEVVDIGCPLVWE